MRLVATPILLLGLLAFLAWGAYWGWNNLTKPFPTPEPTPCATVSTSTVTPQQVAVRVINGGPTAGQATKIGDQLEPLGFRVIQIGNTEEKVAVPVIIRSGTNNVAAAQLVASYLKDATTETDARVDGTVDVVLGVGGGAMAESGQLSEVPVEGGTICLAPAPSPSPTPSIP